ncbi:MAG TPA: hypothetical protein VFQ45_04690 [Longimicrobium sp.]|nr:hypothetical protein [Longimicrobium sp.]
MYRHCIFCSAPLGANDVVEHFPVGRSLAFDAERGRLWAVCPRCARWNLAPIEERWEAIEAAERLFRDCRLRVQSENVGLARLRDGTRLVRVGRALPGELALWRYGRVLGRRRAAYTAAAGVGLGVGVGAPAAALLGLSGAAAGLGIAAYVLFAAGQWRPRMESRSLLPYTGLQVDADHLRKARFAFTFHGEVGLAVEVAEEDVPLDMGGWRDGVLVLPEEHARTMLRRGLVELNAAGAGADRVRAAVNLLGVSGSAESFLRRAAADGMPVDDPSRDRWVRGTRLLALEMAVHDDLEREAVRGELAALEAAWRQAEEVAAIADALPDELPGQAAPEP